MLRWLVVAVAVLLLAAPAGAQERVYLPVVVSDGPVVVNGSFEAGGIVGWAEYSRNDWPVIMCQDVPTHAGRCAAFMGADWGAVDVFAQHVTVPDGATLTFWRRIPPGGDLCGRGRLEVSVDVRQVVYKQDVCEPTAGWQPVTVDLSGYAGRTVLLAFVLRTGVAPWANRAWCAIDDVAVRRYGD